MEKASLVSQRISKSRILDSERSILTAAKGGGITFAGQLFSHFVTFAFVLVIARQLGAELYGLYKLAFIISNFAAVLCLLGLTKGLTRYIPIARIEKNENKLRGIIQIGLSIPLILGLVLFLTVFLGAVPISIHLFNEPSLAPVLKLASISIPLFTIRAIIAAVAQGFKKVQYEVYSQNITKNVLQFLFAVFIVTLGFGVMGVTAARLLAIAISLIMFFYLVNGIFSFNRPVNNSKRYIREILYFSLPLYFSQILDQFGRRFETLVLGIFGVISEVGVYSVILNISLIGKMGFSALRKISVPIISELHSQNKSDELEIYYQTITKWAFSFNLPIFFTLLLFADNLLLIFGKDFAIGAMGLIILAGGTLYDASTGICGAVINMSGHSKVAFYNSVVYFVTTLILDFILIPQWYLIGAALAGAFTIFIVNTIRMVEVYILLKGLLPFNWTFLKPIVAIILASALTFWLRQSVLVSSPVVQLLILSIIMWSAYIVMLVGLKLSAEDRLILRKTWNRLSRKK